MSTEQSFPASFCEAQAESCQFIADGLKQGAMREEWDRMALEWRSAANRPANDDEPPAS